MSVLSNISRTYKSFYYICPALGTFSIHYTKILEVLEKQIGGRITDHWKKDSSSNLGLFLHATHGLTNEIANGADKACICEGSNKHWLVDTISNDGIQTPLLVFTLTEEESIEYKFFVLDGSHRLAVAKELQIKEVPILVFERCSNGT